MRRQTPRRGILQALTLTSPKEHVDKRANGGADAVAGE
jgi:hypothetical protein